MNDPRLPTDPTVAPTGSGSSDQNAPSPAQETPKAKKPLIRTRIVFKMSDVSKGSIPKPDKGT